MVPDTYGRQIKLHTYNDSMYKDKCYNLYYITRISYKIIDIKYFELR
jgi:hypothetical protein